MAGTIATPAQFAANTARSYALVGFIFYLLGAVAWGIGLLFFLVTVPVRAGMMGTFVFPAIFPFGVFGVLSVGFALWSWITLRQLDQGHYTEAQTSALILGIFGIFLAFLIGGIFFLLAYIKIGEVLQPPMVYPPMMPQPTVAPPAQRFCTACGRAVALDAKFCPICGKQLPA